MAAKTINRDASAYEVKGKGRQGKSPQTIERMATVANIRKEAGPKFAMHLDQDLPGISRPSVLSLLRTIAKEAGERVSVQSTRDDNVVVVEFKQK